MNNDTITFLITITIGIILAIFAVRRGWAKHASNAIHR